MDSSPINVFDGIRLAESQNFSGFKTFSLIQYFHKRQAAFKKSYEELPTDTYELKFIQLIFNLFWFLAAFSIQSPTTATTQIRPQLSQTFL